VHLHQWAVGLFHWTIVNNKGELLISFFQLSCYVVPKKNYPKQGDTSKKSSFNMAVSGLRCRKPLVSTGWVISLLLCMNGLRKLSSGHACRASISILGCRVTATREMED